MPKTTINEIDNSRFVASTAPAPMTVIVPGTASFGPVADPTANLLTFSGSDSLTDFLLQYGTSPAKYKNADEVAKTVTGDYTFEYVTNLIRSGAAVIFLRLNDGETAKCVVNEDAATADQKSIVAKYSGSFGNKICCKFEMVSDSETDAYISVYISDSEFTADHKATIDTIKNWNEIFFTRLSINPNSAYYVNQTINLEYVSLDPDTLTIIINKLNQINTTDKALVYTLLDGADFKNKVSSDSDAKNAIFSRLNGNADNNIISIYEELVDPYIFDFDFVTCGGITFNSNEDTTMRNCHKAMIHLCERRGDCVALLDTPEDDLYTDIITYANTAHDFDTSYAAFYAPWCSFVSATSGRVIFMPSSLIFMKAVLYNMAAATDPQLWYIPAGVTRTSAPFIVEPKYSIGSVILDEFQNNTNRLNKINPIMKVKNYGYCVYGNSTAMKQISPKSHSALESMNVRLIANVIKRYIFDICCGLSFEYNNSELWLKFYSQMDEKLLYMKRNYGLYDYRIIMDTTTVTQEAINNRRVPGKVMISPNLAGEFFDIDFEIFPSGVTFGEGE